MTNLFVALQIVTSYSLEHFYLIHMCKVIESADDQGDSSSDVDVLAVSVGVSVGILAVAIAAGVLLMVVRKRVNHYWQTRKGEDSK